MAKQHYVIIVADDDPAINELVSTLLEDEGYKVLSCTTGAEALQVAARVRPDLVLTDMQMETREAGLRLLERLRADPGTAGVAVIVCSADRDSLARRSEAIRQYGADMLAKPFLVDELLATIRRLLQPHELP